MGATTDGATPLLVHTGRRYHLEIDGKRVWSSEPDAVCGVGRHTVAIVKDGLFRFDIATSTTSRVECDNMPSDVQSVRVSADDAIVSCTDANGDTFVLAWNREKTWIKTLRIPLPAADSVEKRGSEYLRNGPDLLASQRLVDVPLEFAIKSQQDACFGHYGDCVYSESDILDAAARSGIHTEMTARHLRGLANQMADMDCCNLGHAIVVMAGDAGQKIVHGSSDVLGPHAPMDDAIFEVVVITPDMLKASATRTGYTALSRGDHVRVLHGTCTIFRAPSTPPCVALDNVHVAWVSAHNPLEIVESMYRVKHATGSLDLLGMPHVRRISHLAYGKDDILLVCATGEHNDEQISLLVAVKRGVLVRGAFLWHTWTTARLADNGRDVLVDGQTIASLPDTCTPSMPAEHNMLGYTQHAGPTTVPVLVV
jgi:hypothetical protein